MDVHQHLLDLLPDENSTLLNLLKVLEFPVIIGNGVGKIIFWNVGAAKAFQYTEKEAIGHPLALIIPERFREAHATSFAAWETMKTPRTFVTSKVFDSALNLFGLRKDGTEFPCTVAISAYKSKDMVCFLGVINTNPTHTTTDDATNSIVGINLAIKKRIEEMDKSQAVIKIPE